MENITEGIIEFKDFEKKMHEILCQVGCELISEYLQACDKKLMERRDTKEYRIINTGTTTIKTIMGEVSYSRRYYKKKTGGYVFLLDEALGIGNGIGLISENLAEEIVIECSEKSFRKAAGSISSFTGQTISAMGAWNILQQYGDRIEEKEDRLHELDKKGVAGQLGNISTRVLFEELDDVWLSMQKAKRRRQGVGNEAKEKKAGKKPIHIGTAYTGWSKINDGKYNTIDKIAYVSIGDVRGFISNFEVLKRNCYDMDGVENQVTNGDGASWIKTASAENDTILQLDPFHRSQAIIRAISKEEDRKNIYNAIREKDVEKVLQVTYDMVVNASDDDTREKIGRLYGYLYDNKESLLSWKERGIQLPVPPEGVVYRNLGTQEASNCDLITQRMKHRKGSWSIKGANHMAKILCYRHTIGLDAILGAPQETLSTEMETKMTPLSAAKTPQYDGHGYDGNWLYAQLPFEQTFITGGRNAIRGILGQKPISDLSFI